MPLPHSPLPYPGPQGPWGFRCMVSIVLAVRRTRQPLRTGSIVSLLAPIVHVSRLHAQMCGSIRLLVPSLRLSFGGAMLNTQRACMSMPSKCKYSFLGCPHRWRPGRWHAAQDTEHRVAIYGPGHKTSGSERLYGGPLWYRSWHHCG